MGKIVIALVTIFVLYKVYHKGKRLLRQYDPAPEIIKILNNKTDNYNAIQRIQELAHRNKAVAVITYVDINHKECIVSWNYENDSIKNFHFKKYKYWREIQ